MACQLVGLLVRLSRLQKQLELYSKTFGSLCDFHNSVFCKGQVCSISDEMIKL